MNLIELRKMIGRAQGFGDNFAGTLEEFNSLPVEQRAQLTNSVLRYIDANPDGYPAPLVASATRIVNDGGILPPDTFTFPE